jgi:glycosyltransferase involved in cell wall biosynthesis
VKETKWPFNAMAAKYRLAIVASHPIQYQAPLFKTLASHPALDVTVFYCSDVGASAPALDEELGVRFQWDRPLLDGYGYRFLHNLSRSPRHSLFGEINPAIVWQLRSGRFDAVLVHGYITLTAWFVFLTVLYTRARVVLRGEAMLVPNRRKVRSAVKALILRPLFRSVPAFLYSCQSNREFFQHYGVPQRKLFPFPCAVDNAFFASESRRLETRRAETRVSVGIQDERVTFVFVGKLIPRKRVRDILHACILLKGVAPFDVLVVGDGEQLRELTEFALEHELDHVRFLGFKNQTELSTIYTAADALILPSDLDPSPKQLNEAMNFGLALIVSDGVGTAPDLVLETGAGVMYRVGDVTALAAHMASFATNASILSEHRQAAKRAVERWSFEEDAAGLVRALDFAIPSSHRNA